MARHKVVAFSTHIKRTLMFISCSLFITFGSGTKAFAAPALAITGGNAVNVSDGSSIYGWAFDVFSETTVLSLGLWDDLGNGLAEAHDIGLWDSAGTLLTSTSIAAGTGGTLIDSFRYTDVPEIVLGIGSGYVIAANNFDVDPMIVDATSVTTVGDIGFVGGRGGSGSGGFAYPNGFSTNNNRFFGPNFLVATTADVPEINGSQLGIALTLLLSLVLLYREREGFQA